ncbi:MAG: DUF4376 domain-containing protein [Telmatospirillum sp.]|nr:DUF4376 domain-containing protein [Telmatospirillum sp.]
MGVRVRPLSGHGRYGRKYSHCDRNGGGMTSFTLALQGPQIVAATTNCQAVPQGFLLDGVLFSPSCGFTFQQVDGSTLPADFSPSQYQWMGGALQRLPDTAAQVAAAQVAASGAVTAFYFAYVAKGCPVDFSQYGNPSAILPTGQTVPAGQQVLQTRNETDTSNWILLESSCADLISAQQGATPVTIRTASNATVTVSATQAKAVMAAAKKRGSAILAYAWTLKNQIASAQTVAAVKAIDITAGWPA